MADANNSVENKSGTVAQMLYKYYIDNEDTPSRIRDLLQVDIPDDAQAYISAGKNNYNMVDYTNGYYGRVFNMDESMQPRPEQFMAYTGSILSMIKDLSNKPFNEYFFSHEEGKATLHYRVTPFEEEDWFNIPYIEVFDQDTINIDLSRSDVEQYSVFKLSSPTATKKAAANGMVLPITDDKNELEGHYGYKTMEVQSLYFDNPSSSTAEDNTADKANNKGNDQTDDQQAAKFYPSWNTVVNYPKVDKKLTKDDRQTIANQYTISSAYGGDALYDLLGKIANDNTKNMQERVAAIMKESQTYCDQHGIANPITNYAASHLVTQAAAGKYNKYNYIMTALPPQERLFPINNTQTGTSSTGQLTYMLATAEGRRSHPNLAARDIVILSQGRIGSEQARALVDAWNKDGELTPEAYKHIMDAVSHSDKNSAVIGGQNAVNNINSTYRQYELKLFNWYADNSKYYAGNIQVVGTFYVEIGKRLYLHRERENDMLWEFYIEAVSHSFDFQNGWITTIGVTRGLPVRYIGDPIRFRLFWGHGADFTGGFFGEPTIQEALAEANANNSDGDDSSGSSSGPSRSGSKAANAAAKLALKYAGSNSIYSQAAHGNDFIKAGAPYRTDCSGFVYFIFKHAGFNWGSGVLNTWGIAASPKVTTVGASGSNKTATWNKMRIGDIVFWEGDGHVGIYVGHGDCVAMNGSFEGDSGANSGIRKFAAGPGSYWWNLFSGHVVRVK